MAGVLQCATIDSGTPVQLIKAGKLRAIAALSGRRLPQLPDVPTQGEQGFPLESAPWYGLFGPASMPPELVKPDQRGAEQVARAARHQGFLCREAEQPVSDPQVTLKRLPRRSSASWWRGRRWWLTPRSDRRAFAGRVCAAGLLRRIAGHR